MDGPLITHTWLTCPFCGFREELPIPADACLVAQRCANCNMEIKPPPGECCLFCAYGQDPCLPRQEKQQSARQGEVPR